VDSDVGPADDDEYPNMYLDDLVGFAEIDTTIVDLRPSTPANCRRTQVKIQLGYMRDLPDATHSITDTGDVPGWFGGLFLGHSTDPAGIVAPTDVGIRTFVWFAQGGAIRDPENDFERYELLSRNSRTDEGLFIQEPPSDPRDYRYVLAVGPFSELLPDTFLTFQVAFVMGDGYEGPNGLKTNAVNAQRIFDGDFFNLDGDAATGIFGREKCTYCGGSGPLSTIDHDCDPQNEEVQCERSTCTWIDGDCTNPAHTCTGAGGREARVNWIGVSPPPAPPIAVGTAGEVTGVESGDIDCLGGDLATASSNEVMVYWDNLVDKSVNPITGEKNFKGYRVWKAANWERESSSVPTESFQLLGDFSAVADSSCVRLVALKPGVVGTPPFPDTDYVTWDFCLPSHEGFEFYLAGLARPEDSPCPVSVLETRKQNEPFFLAEGQRPDLAVDSALVYSKDIGSCPLGYLIDRSGGYRPIDVSTCSERYLQVARPHIMGGETVYVQEDSLVGTVCDTLWCKGYYRFNDRNVLPGYPYFYVVTAYSEAVEEVQGEQQVIELHTRPASSEESAVFPGSAPAAGCDAIKVVPNPYLGGAGWDLKPNPTDPTGTKIAFNNLPPGSTVRIFTLAGDLVESLTSEEQDGGTSYWDLISRNGQDIVSGIYLYSVEAPACSQIGKFVVVR
jgi:hypothetical protein